MYAGEVIGRRGRRRAGAAVASTYVARAHLSERRGKLASIGPGAFHHGYAERLPLQGALCTRSMVEAQQELRDAGGGRKVRCWRFGELDLPGALQHAATAPIAAMVAQ